MANTAVIIVNYNKKQLLLDCLNSLKKSVESEKQIIVVDNGSSDGSKEMVKEYPGEIQLIEMGYNSGFCKANNEGIKKALKQGSENVILLNNDTVVDEDFVKEMEATLNRKEKIGMIAAQIVLMNKPSLLDSAGISITPDGLGKNRGYGQRKDLFQHEKEVFCPAGAAALFSKELLEDIKQNEQYLDEEYEFYLEEVDLGWRARLRGWKCLYQPKAEVFHLKRASTDQFAEKMMFFANRNIYLNIIKNYPSFYYVVKALKLSFVRNVVLLFGVLKGKGVVNERKSQVSILVMAKLYIKGLFHVLAAIRELLDKRKYIQNRKTVSAKEIKRIFKELGLNFFESIYKL